MGGVVNVPVGEPMRVDDDTCILAIETSCDETAAAVVVGGTRVRSSVVSSQIDLHARFGGVVPEIASRAHVDLCIPVIDQAMVEAGVGSGDIDAVAVTHGPGLVGALLVGVATAKALALAWNVPLIGVNHLEGHLAAASLENPDLPSPLVVLLVSGGHTMLVAMESPTSYEVLGSTLDDAAGEAYDKVARFLGLGYPGGPLIDRLAAEGDPEAVRLPRAMPGDNFDFSFSGLKTAVINAVRRDPSLSDADVAAGFQAAVVAVLVDKARRAAARIGAKGISIGGGVAANSALRRRIVEVCEADGLEACVPAREMCTDNAAMIGAAAHHRLAIDGPDAATLGADPGLGLGV